MRQIILSNMQFSQVGFLFGILFWRCVVLRLCGARYIMGCGDGGKASVIIVTIIIVNIKKTVCSYI